MPATTTTFTIDSRESPKGRRPRPRSPRRRWIPDAQEESCTRSIRRVSVPAGAIAMSIPLARIVPPAGARTASRTTLPAVTGIDREPLVSTGRARRGRDSRGHRERRSAAVSIVKSRMYRAAPARPMRCRVVRIVGESSNGVGQAVAASPGATRSPSTPCVISSGMAPAVVLTTAVP